MKKPTGVPAIDEHYINSEPFGPSDADLRTQAKVIDNASNENVAGGDVSDDVLETLQKRTDAGTDVPAPHKSSLEGKEDVVDKTFVRDEDGNKLDEVNESDADTADKLGEKDPSVVRDKSAKASNKAKAKVKK